MSEKGGGVRRSHRTCRMRRSRSSGRSSGRERSSVARATRIGIALAVDGAAKAYRLVCTQCGLASPWFGTTPSGLVFRSPPPTVSPNGGNLHDE